MAPIKLTLVAAAAALAFAGPGLAADTMSKDQYKAEKQRIDSDAKAAKEKCKGMSGNLKDICMADANGIQKVAKAELAMKQKDTPKARYNVSVAKAGMDYNVAKEKCDESAGKAKRACVKDAKAAHDQAKKQAKAERDSAEGKTRTAMGK